jgi:hypothetical protein
VLWISLVSYDLFNGAVSVSDFTRDEWYTDLWIMSCKGCGRRRPWPNLKYSPASVWKDWLQKQFSVNTAGLRATIWTPDFQNTNQEFYPLVRDVHSFCHVSGTTYEKAKFLRRKQDGAIGTAVFMAVIIACCFLLPICLLHLFFDPEGGGSLFLLNAGKRPPDYTASHARK